VQARAQVEVGGDRARHGRGGLGRCAALDEQLRRGQRACAGVAQVNSAQQLAATRRDTHDPRASADAPSVTMVDGRWARAGGEATEPSPVVGAAVGVLLGVEPRLKNRPTRSIAELRGVPRRRAASSSRCAHVRETRARARARRQRAQRGRRRMRSPSEPPPPSCARGNAAPPAAPRPGTAIGQRSAGAVAQPRASARLAVLDAAVHKPREQSDGRDGHGGHGGNDDDPARASPRRTLIIRVVRLPAYCARTAPPWTACCRRIAR
jgi:hypothetical protein